MKLEAQKEKLKNLTKFIRLGKLRKLQDYEDALPVYVISKQLWGKMRPSGEAFYKLDGSGSEARKHHQCWAQLLSVAAAFESLMVMQWTYTLLGSLS